MFVLFLRAASEMSPPPADQEGALLGGSVWCVFFKKV